MIKTYIFIIIAVLSFGGGMLTHAKLFKQKIEIPPCPDCNCPPAIQINGLDISELRKMKIRGGFNYSPTFQADKINIIQSNDSIGSK